MAVYIVCGARCGGAFASVGMTGWKESRQDGNERTELKVAWPAKSCGAMTFGANPTTEGVISVPLRSGGLSFVPARRFRSGHESGLGFLNGWAKNLPQLEDDCEGLYDELD